MANSHPKRTSFNRSEQFLLLCLFQFIIMARRNGRIQWLFTGVLDVSMHFALCIMQLKYIAEEFVAFYFYIKTMKKAIVVAKMNKGWISIHLAFSRIPKLLEINRSALVPWHSVFIRSFRMSFFSIYTNYNDWTCRSIWWRIGDTVSALRGVASVRHCWNGTKLSIRMFLASLSRKKSQILVLPIILVGNKTAEQMSKETWRILWCTYLYIKHYLQLHIHRIYENLSEQKLFHIIEITCISFLYLRYPLSLLIFIAIPLSLSLAVFFVLSHGCHPLELSLLFFILFCILCLSTLNVIAFHIIWHILARTHTHNTKWFRAFLARCVQLGSNKRNEEWSSSRRGRWRMCVCEKKTT